MKILLVGGGSGGHIMPLLAVAKQIKKKKPEAEIYAACERGSAFKSLFGGHSEINNIYHIFAGKLRRYHGESFLRRLTDIKTIALNVRDFFLMTLGIFESIFLLLKLRPGVVLIKGGYVGVPIGVAARLLRVPYITHDSDATAGLTNKLIGSHALFNAVGMDSRYHYEKSKTKYIGVPISEEYSNRKAKDLAESERKHYGITSKNEVLLILGGSNGAKRLDAIMRRVVVDLLDNNPDLYIIHQVGRGNEDIYKDLDDKYLPRIHAKRFISPLSPALSLADVVVSRAGATTLSEIAAYSKPAILIPHPELSGGHQLKNAQILQDKSAVISLDEYEMAMDPKLLAKEISRLLDSPGDAKALANNLHLAVKTDAAESLANMLLAAAEERT